MTPAPPTQLPNAADRMVVTADLLHLSPRAAFSCFTQPEQLARWWPPSAEVDPRLDGRFRMMWPSMGWELFGQFTAFEPDNHLAFTWQWVHRPELPGRVVEVVFAPAGDGCRVTVTHGAYGNSEVEQADRQSHVDGWLHFLGRLQALTQP
jgi:uncharacterized protein YndB with AHSA1/START domain